MHCFYYMPRILISICSPYSLILYYTVFYASLYYTAYMDDILYHTTILHYTIHIQDIIGKKAAVLQAQEANDVTLRRILSLIDPSTKEGRGKILVYFVHINLLRSLLYCVVYVYVCEYILQFYVHLLLEPYCMIVQIIVQPYILYTCVTLYPV